MKRLLLRLLAALVVVGVSGPNLRSQETPAAGPVKTVAGEPAVKLDTFTVTGSNIRRQDAESALPVTVLSREAIDLSGGVTPIEFLQTLPFIGATVINESDAKSSVGARGDVSFVNLRSLPSGNTLVLLNGRRMVPHGIAQATDGATGSGVGAPALSVNVATIPQAAVDHVEVLRDGASAVYGSDASAGVINNIMSRNLQSWTARARYGGSMEGGLGETSFSISGGTTFNGGRTNVSATVDLYNRQGLLRSQRDWALQGDLRPRTPAPWDGVPVAGITNNTQLRTSIVGYTFRVGGINSGNRPTGNLGISTTANNTSALTLSTSGQFWVLPGATTPTIMNSTPSATVPAQASYYSTTALGIRTLIPKSDRANVFLTFDHQLTAKVDAYADLSFYHSTSVFYREPNTASSTVDNPFMVGVDNPYNPFGSRFYDPAGAPNADGTPRLTGTPTAVYFVTRQFWDLPKIKSEISNQALRGLVGLKGKIGESAWTWDSGLLLSRNAVTDRNVEGMIRISKLREALVRSGANAFNPFGTTFAIGADGVIQANGNYTNPAPVVDFVKNPADRPGRYGKTQLMLADFKVSGQVFDLPAGPLGVAAGVEFRYESYVNDRDTFFGTNPANAGTYFNPPTASAADFVGEASDIRIDDSRKISSAFAEVVLPLLSAKQAVPLVKRFELSAAARAEHYSTFGTVTKPKYGAMWTVFDWLKFRGAFSKSFLAPNMAQTYPGFLYRFVNAISDPYRFDVTGLANTDGPNTLARLALRGGGQSLRPETSTNANVGMVFSPPVIKGLTVTVDYWSLKQRNAISSLGAAVLFQQDQAQLDRYVQNQLTAGQSINQIDLGSGTSSYKGLSLVNRAPVTAEDTAAYNAYNAGRPASQQRAPVGAAVSVVDAFLNLSARNIEGYDIETEYRFPRSATWGRVMLNATAAYQKKYEVQPSPGATLIDYRSFNRDLIPIPLWRGTATVTWTSPKNRWMTGALAEMQSKWQDTRLLTTTAVRQALGNPDYISGTNYYVVPEQWYFNAFGGYAFADASRSTVGRWLNDTSIRVGVNNVLNKSPQITGSVTYFESGGSSLALHGRSAYVELKKRF